jgi:hypothetical protein
MKAPERGLDGGTRAPLYRRSLLVNGPSRRFYSLFLCHSGARLRHRRGEAPLCDLICSKGLIQIGTAKIEERRDLAPRIMSVLMGMSVLIGTSPGRHLDRHGDRRLVDEICKICGTWSYIIVQYLTAQ